MQIWLDHLEFDEDTAPTQQRDFLPWVLLIARRTGLRLGEICRIRTCDVDLDEPSIHFGDTKNGDAFDCPLRTDAVALLRKLLKHRAGEEKLIDPTAAVIGELYRRERKVIAAMHPAHANIVIHSLRHTYTTEMVARVPDKMMLLRITGRRTLQSLTRYYKPGAADLAKMMG
jgi:integrase